MKKILIAIATEVVLLSNGAWAGGVYTGDTLLLLCTPQNVDYEHGFCEGFVAGVDHIHDIFVTLGNVERLYCLPVGATGQAQLAEVVVKFLSNSVLQSADASNLVLMALVEAFPCE